MATKKEKVILNTLTHYHSGEEEIVNLGEKSEFVPKCAATK